MFIDTHTHFDMILENEEISEEALLNSLQDKRVMRAVQVSIDIPSTRWSREFVKRNRNRPVLFTIGLHPSSKADDMELLQQELDSILDSFDGDYLLGIGECGLDFYRMRQPKKMQLQSFEFQIALAKEHRLPLIVHSRDAIDETIAMLKTHSPLYGIIHCFPGNTYAARQFLDLGFYLSFAGNVTYPKATVLHESAVYTPLDRLLIETDAPFLTPVPYRGKKNRPEFIEYTYRSIAALRNEPLEKLASAVADNFNALVQKAGRCATESRRDGVEI